MAIEIVSFPINNGGSFHSYVNVYQRLSSVFSVFSVVIVELPVDEIMVYLHSLNSQVKLHLLKAKSLINRFHIHIIHHPAIKKCCHPVPSS